MTEEEQAALYRRRVTEAYFDRLTAENRLAVERKIAALLSRQREQKGGEADGSSGDGHHQSDS